MRRQGWFRKFILFKILTTLLCYFRKHRNNLLKGKYADIPKSLTHSFKSLATHEFFARFGVNFPDVEEDFFDDIESLCQDSWESKR